MIWVEGATNWNHWKEVLIDRGLNKKQESSEVASELDGGVVLQPKCQKVAVRVRPTRLTVALSPTSPKDQSYFPWNWWYSPGDMQFKRPEKGRIGKSWVASSCLAVSDLLRSRKGRLVCKACQWFVWFVAGFSCCYNNSETKIRCSVRLPAPGPEARLTWLDLKPNPWMPTVAASVAAILYWYT